MYELWRIDEQFPLISIGVLVFLLTSLNFNAASAVMGGRDMYVYISRINMYVTHELGCRVYIKMR